MRALAQVCKIALLVQANLFVGNLADQLQLVRLVCETFSCFVLRDEGRLKRHVRLDAVSHLLLDQWKIVEGKRAWQLEIVVEAGIDRGTDTDPGVREHLSHGFGHDMSGRVPHALEAFFFRQVLQVKHSSPRTYPSGAIQASFP